MKQLILILIFLLLGLQLFAQQEKSYVKKGNDFYQQKKYKEAADSYSKAVAKKSENLEGNFNLGDAFYKQKQFDKAGEQFNKIAESNKNKAIAAGAYHNLGNTLLENKKLEESIEAYKKSLLNNPKDEETRYNLAYAQEKLKQQQQKDKNKDKNKNQDKNRQDQNKQNKDDKNKDKNKDNKDQDKQNKDQDKKDQQQQPEPNKLSKEDAQRMLDALNNEEKQTQDKLKNKKAKAATRGISKDW
ncbi:MAG: tetratricopeptide repeat protein [Bacteroidota bacterium]